MSPMTSLSPGRLVGRLVGGARWLPRRSPRRGALRNRDHGPGRSANPGWLTWPGGPSSSAPGRPNSPPTSTPHPPHPAPPTLHQVREHIHQVVARGTAQERKGLYEALIDHIEITSDDTFIPAYRVPATANPNGPAPDWAEPAVSGGNGAVRALGVRWSS